MVCFAPYEGSERGASGIAVAMKQSRSTRRRIRRPGVAVDLAADLNAVVSTGGHTSAIQGVSLTQHREQPVRDRSTRTEEEK